MVIDTIKYSVQCFISIVRCTSKPSASRLCRKIIIMKKINDLIIFCLTFSFLSCLGNKEFIEIKEKCDENLLFKQEFSKNLYILDSYYKNKSKSIKIAEDTNLNFQEKLEKLDEIKSNYYVALDFFSKYSKISYNYTGNYTNEIPYNIYKKEREAWIDWYNKNKCNNLQLDE